jgi:hypothetical protein
MSTRRTNNIIIFLTSGTSGWYRYLARKGQHPVSGKETFANGPKLITGNPHSLQAYICRAHIEDFALVSDTAYVAQVGRRAITFSIRHSSRLS